VFAFDITAVVNLHAEGSLAHATLRSLSRARVYGENRGLRIEVLAVLDRPSAATVGLLQACTLDCCTSVQVSFGDLGRARNHAVEIAHGEWITFLDGDDLWAENWLATAYAAAASDPRPIIWHPLALIMFGAQSYLFTHIDMEDDDFEVAGLALQNLWSAQSFARRELYASVPFPATDRQRQLGYEDWGWNLETVAKGYLHKSVPGTANGCRKKDQGSLLQKTAASRAMPNPTILFRDMVQSRSGK
jgi:hypothetical protein